MVPAALTQKQVASLAGITPGHFKTRLDRGETPRPVADEWTIVDAVIADIVQNITVPPLSLREVVELMEPSRRLLAEAIRESWPNKLGSYVGLSWVVAPIEQEGRRVAGVTPILSLAPSWQGIAEDAERDGMVIRATGVSVGACCARVKARAQQFGVDFEVAAPKKPRSAH